MGLINNIVLNGFAVLVLIILCVYSIKKYETSSTQHRLYFAALLANMLLLILDVLSRTDGKLGTIYPLINQVSNLILFLLNPLLSSIWCLYANFQVFRDTKKLKKLGSLLLVANIINAGVVILSQFNGWYYYIDANNIYHRGPYFIASAMIPLVFIIAAFIFISIHKKKISKKQLFSLVFFPLPPLLGTLLQIYIYGYAFTLISIVLSLLVVLLQMKDNTIYTDHLTGIGNRKKLDAVLTESIQKSSDRRTFSLVLLDIDDFKIINDSFGHEMGDEVLKAIAELLKGCIRSRDCVVRYGGDEFCIVLDLYDEKDLSSTLNRINRRLEMLNEMELFPFHISFAQGNAIYDYQSRLKAEDFFSRVDMIMYENKRAKKMNSSFTQKAIT